VRVADLLLALLGLYFATALAVAAWRRRAEGSGGIALWVSVFGVWAMLALGRWLPSRPLVAAAAWAVTARLLVLAGATLGRRSTPRAWLWLLGPAQALAAISGDWRARRRSAPAAAAPPAGEVVESVLELGETTVSEVMVPRGEIRALPEGARVRDWARLTSDSRHGNLPVYRSDLDEIAGYVTLSDLWGASDPDAPVTGFLREPRFVPETMRCDDALRDLVAHGERIAIAVDEFGGTAGLVRERDLLEILLGEIDRGSAVALRRVEPGVFVADGACRVDDFNEAAGAALPEGGYETLAGLVLARMGRIPATGESLTVEDAQIEVLAASERRVLTVRIVFPVAAGKGPDRGDR
jgi:CBS domain containing-hemolysin-like protein